MTPEGSGPVPKESPKNRAERSAPYFSVIVMTWQRREFLESAVSSVLSQTLPRSEYEILVVKGFQDDQLDTFLRSCGAQVYATTSSDQGPALATAFGHAKGEVVAFLDDDDEFEPEKLATLLTEFEAAPDLVVMRHGNRNIDARGDPLPSWPLCDWPALPRSDVVVVATPEEKGRTPTLPMHNLSTIAVRRSAVLPFVRAWPGVEAASDSLVFLSGLACPGAARADPRVLSRRRIHGSSSNENFSTAGAGPPATLDRLHRLVRSHARQREMVRGTPAERSAAWVDLILRFDAAMSSSTFPNPTVRDHLAMIRGAVREHQPFRFWIVGFALARRLAPERAIRMWWRFCQVRHRALFPKVNYPALFPHRPTRASRTSVGSPD